MSDKRTIPIGTVALFLLWIVLLIGALILWRSAAKTVPPELQAVLWPQPKPVQSFTLLDQQSEPFSESDLAGKWSFLFFGYTHCPDICPTTLVTLKRISDRLKQHPDRSGDFQVVFVSVDPDRDSPEVLADYMAYFDRQFTGVTGPEQEINQLVGQFGAGYVKEPALTSGEYLISHSASIFLVDPQVRLVAFFSPPLSPDEIASQYWEIRDLF